MMQRECYTKDASNGRAKAPVTVEVFSLGKDINPETVVLGITLKALLVFGRVWPKLPSTSNQTAMIVGILISNDCKAAAAVTKRNKWQYPYPSLSVFLTSQAQPGCTFKEMRGHQSESH